MSLEFGEEYLVNYPVSVAKVPKKVVYCGRTCGEKPKNIFVELRLPAQVPTSTVHLNKGIDAILCDDEGFTLAGKLIDFKNYELEELGYSFDLLHIRQAMEIRFK
jgi:hypothetical protein